MSVSPTLSIPASLNRADLQKLPLESAETIPASWYVDPAFHAFDHQAILRQEWQYAGPEARIAKPGDFMVEEVAGIPLLISRGQDGQVRAFANVCRHRGGVVAFEDGSGRVLRCQYHGWSYGFDGKLIGTPQFTAKETLKPHQCRLPQYAARVWNGLVMVNLSDKPRPFEETFGGIEERIAPLKMCSTFHRRVIFEVEANWKIYVDNYLEGYHVPVVHPELSAIIDNDQYLYELSKLYSLQYSPIRQKDNPYGAQGMAFYFWIYPNIMLNILDGRMQVNSVIPKGPERCQVYFDFYFADQTSAEGLERIRSDLSLSEIVQDQDAIVCRAVQKGLKSGTYSVGRLVPSQEMAVQHFQDLVRSSYERALG